MDTPLVARADAPTEARLEQLKLEHATLMHEYNVVYTGINTHNQLSAGLTGVTTTAAAALIGGAQFLQPNPVLFLVAPFIFYMLAWIHLRYMLVNNHLVSYLRNDLRPALHRTLSAITPGEARSFSHVVALEERYAQLEQRVSPILLPTSAAPYLFNLLTAVLSVGGYLALRLPLTQNVTNAERVLLVVNIALLIYSVSWRLAVRRQVKASGMDHLPLS
jgi:hypothetical protein